MDEYSVTQKFEREFLEEKDQTAEVGFDKITIQETKELFDKRGVGFWARKIIEVDNLPEAKDIAAHILKIIGI